MNLVPDRLRRRPFPFAVLALAFFAFLFHLSLTISVAAPRAQETATPTPAAATPTLGAQTAAEPGPGEWTPVNLSRSGAATGASMVVGADGVVHVVWQEDGDDSFYYATGEGDQWSAPARLEFPFGTRAYTPDLSEDDPTPLYRPQFVSVDGITFAFWIDDEGIAYVSNVASAEFATFSAWSAPQEIAGGVLALSVSAGVDGVLHVGYVRSAEAAESPAGIYYTGSDSSGTAWSEPVALFSSRYFRALPAEEAHVQVATDGAGDVFVVWDSRPIDQVFVVRSGDGGQSWGEPQVVDSHRSDDAPEAVGPSQIQVSARGESVHLTWTAAHTTPLCTVYHQWSADGGGTWEEPQQVLEETTNCPERPRLVWGLDGVLFLVTNVGADARFVAWQEGEWSNPQLQATLGSFFNPANNRRVEFRRQQISFLNGDTLVALGTSVTQPGDIWALLGSVGTVADWFPPPSPWQTPVPLSRYTEAPDEIVIVSDAQNLLHAFWTEPASNDGEPETLAYARWSDMEWGRPAPALSSPSGPSTDPSVATGPSGRLYAVWAAEPGQLYFSQALATEANVAREWSEPLMLPIEHEAARSPVISIDGEGTLYVAYAVALNEERGIFLSLSEDQGATWEPPIQVFDGVAAGWAMVDEPRLVAGTGGVLHLTWARYSLPPQAEPRALLYARSEDGGESWSAPETVDEDAPAWSQIAYGRNTVLHQVWQKQDGDEFGFWHRFSLDNGVSWSRAETIGLRNVGRGAPNMAMGPDGRFHLFHLMENVLLHWWWEAEGWTEGESFSLEPPAGEGGGEYEPVAAAAVAADGSVAVLYVRPTVSEGQVEGVQYQLLAVGRTALSPIETEAATTLPTVEPTVTATAAPTVEPTLSPTPTVAFPNAQENGGGGARGSGSNVVNQLLIGLLPVVFILVVVIAFGLRRSWFDRR